MIESGLRTFQLTLARHADLAMQACVSVARALGKRCPKIVKIPSAKVAVSGANWSPESAFVRCINKVHRCHQSRQMINRFMPELHGNYAGLRVVADQLTNILQCNSRKRLRLPMLRF